MHRTTAPSRTGDREREMRPSDPERHRSRRGDPKRLQRREESTLCGRIASTKNANAGIRARRGRSAADRRAVKQAEAQRPRSNAGQ